MGGSIRALTLGRAGGGRRGSVAVAVAVAVVVVATGAGGVARGAVLPSLALPPLPQLPLPTVPNPVFQFVTKFKPPGGQEVDKRQTAIFDVPALLDVDDDGVPDVSATLIAVSTTTFTLAFDRLPTAGSAPLPIVAEAVLTDPTGSLPRHQIYFGFDATASQTPQSWVSTVTLGGTSASPTVDVSTQVSGPGSEITSIGGLFNGDALAPVDPLGGSIRYAPVPQTATLGLTLGASPEVRAGASSSVSATATVTLVNGSRSQTVQAHIASLPQALAVNYAEATSSDALTRTVTYAASSAIPASSSGPSVRIDYTDRTDGALNLEALAKASGIPTGMTFQETSYTGVGVRKGTFTATGGTLGTMEAAFANGAVGPSAFANPYLTVTDNATTQSVAGRIDNLQSASIDATGDVSTDVQLGPGAREPLDAQANLVDSQTTRSMSITGHVSDVPRNLHVSYRPNAGMITYNANGETIDSVDSTLSSNTPLFGRVTYVHGHVEQLPPLVTVNFKPATGSGGSFRTSAAVGLIEAVVTDGRTTCSTLPGGAPCWPLPNRATGAVLQDTPDTFAAWVRLRNVTAGSVTESAQNLQATLDTAPLDPRLDLRQNLTLWATILVPPPRPPGPPPVIDPGVGGSPPPPPPTVIHAEVPSLPNHVSIVQNSANSIIYGATSRIDPQSSNDPGGAAEPLTLTADNLQSGGHGDANDGAVHRLSLTITGVPSRFQLDLGDVGSGVGLAEANGPFGQIDADVWDNGDQRQPFGSDIQNKVAADTRNGRLYIQARVAGLDRAIYKSVLTQSTFDTGFASAPASLAVEYSFGVDTDPGFLAATLNPGAGQSTVPRSSTLQFLSTHGGVDISWSAAAPANVLIDDLETKDLGAHANEPHTSTGIELQLPSTADICVGGEFACLPQSRVSYPGLGDVPNQLTLRVQGASGPITIGGNICTPVANGVVYSHCPGDLSNPTNDVLLHGIVLQNARIEFAQEKEVGGNNDGDDLLKLYLAADGVGLTVGELEYHPDSAWSGGSPTCNPQVIQPSVGPPIAVCVNPPDPTELKATDPLAPDTSVADAFEGVSDINRFQDAESKYQSGILHTLDGAAGCGNLVIKQPNPLGVANGDTVTSHVIPSAWCEGGIL